LYYVIIVAVLISDNFFIAAHWIERFSFQQEKAAKTSIQFYTLFNSYVITVSV